MQAFDTRLFNKQAERIAAQHDLIQTLRAQLNNETQAGKFYLALMRAIQDDIMLQSEWRRFIAILRLSNPDLPGITQAEQEEQF